MTPASRIRRIGWIAVLTVCLALYTVLHVKVNAVRADVVNAERRIVALEESNLLLETEFLTRTNQLQLAAWNRVDFGFQSPEAGQFIEDNRQLASFGKPRGADAPEPIRLAGLRSGEDVPEFPRLVSPLTGRPVDEDVLGTEADEDGGSHLAVTVAPGPLRMPIVGPHFAVTEVAAR
ncbi:hypothetical protein [Aurantiacibacter luteus]|uniref:hypothetical protein n=1 Tax=Aurantiacibacter luteus TaxID=1581420 RepID=UPI00069B00CA|nr:hypothetical protein [Aurantiacibacter luteus]